MVEEIRFLERIHAYEHLKMPHCALFEDIFSALRALSTLPLFPVERVPREETTSRSGQDIKETQVASCVFLILEYSIYSWRICFARKYSDNVINRVGETIKSIARLFARAKAAGRPSLYSKLTRAEERTKFCYFIAQEYLIYRTQEYSRKVLFRLILLKSTTPDKERERLYPSVIFTQTLSYNESLI